MIFPILAEIYQLDLAGTNSASGYDPVYREIRLTSTADGLGTTARVEKTAIQIPMQFEPSSLRRLHMMANGDGASGRVVGIMHFADLEAASLVHSTTGTALIKKGDRLGALRRMDGVLIETIVNPPGAFVTEALPITGLGGYRNLLQVTFESRDPGR